MIVIRPTVFCFLGRVAPDLYGSVPMAIRRRLGAIPDVFAFIGATDGNPRRERNPVQGASLDRGHWSSDSVELKIGARKVTPPNAIGPLANRFWNALTFACASVGNIRVRTDAMRQHPDGERGFHVARGGPDIFLVQCLSDSMGWEIAFAAAEKVHGRNDLLPATGRTRGIFPIFHLPADDEEAEREQALAGLRRLEVLVSRGVLFPSIVLDRFNRNGHPLERWEDLMELLADFLALGSASEAAGDLWRSFPQVADLREGNNGTSGKGPSGLSSIGLGRFRFSREILGEELGRLYLRDLKRALHDTFSRGQAVEGGERPDDFILGLMEKCFTSNPDGLQLATREIVNWIVASASRPPGESTSGLPEPDISFGTWSATVERQQAVLFERMGETAQRIENLRQEHESLSLDSPLVESWIARISILMPGHLAILPPTLVGALIGPIVGFYLYEINLRSYLYGTAFGAMAGLLVGLFLRNRWSKETFTLGEFPHGAFTEGFPVPRTLERFSRRRTRPGIRSGLSIQLWGELRSQVELSAKEQIEARTRALATEIEASRAEEEELVFLDRAINRVRERIEAWRSELQEFDLVDPARGFSGDIFPADGPRRIYQWLGGKEAAEASISTVLSRVRPVEEAQGPVELAESYAMEWGREKSQVLELEQVLQVLNDRPEDLLDRLSEASAPLWPRPGDTDELLRCYAPELNRFAKENDLIHSLAGETIFVRVLGGIRSGEIGRA